MGLGESQRVGRPPAFSKDVRGHLAGWEQVEGKCHAVGANSCPHVAVCVLDLSLPLRPQALGRKEDGVRLARDDELGCSAGQVW